MNNHKSRVVITGMGVTAPGANNLADFQKLITNPVSPIIRHPELEEKGLQCHIGGIAQYNPEIFGEYHDYFSIDKASNFIQLACTAGLEAWQNAGFTFTPNPEADEETGIMIGSGFGAIDFVAEKITPLVNQKKNIRIGGLGAAISMLSAPSAYLSAMLGTGNMHYGNSNACCTGTDAILESFHRIQSGRAKRMLAGSVEGYSPYIWTLFDNAKALNRKFNDRPQEASRPMSESARGFVPSSGAGVLVLESLDSALERGATIYGEVLGGFANSGGHKNGGDMTFPNPRAVITCIERALEYSGVKKEEVDLISGHLTATKADPLEIKNWRTVFDGKFPFINAPKSIFGHCLGGAGAVESIAVALQLYHGFIHPSINCQDLHPEIEKIIPRESIPIEKIDTPELTHVIKASFGFGDVNSCLVFKKWKAQNNN